MSWVANPLPANSTSTQPASTRRARSGAPPVWTTAGPATTSTFPPRSRAARSRSATLATSSAFGFSEETSEAMNSNIWVSRAVAGACTRTPSLPTTTRSPARTLCIGTVSAWPLRRTRPQSISGLSTGSHSPSTRTAPARLVVE